MPLKPLIINNKEYHIVTPNKIHEPYYRTKLSQQLIEKYSRHISGENIMKALIDSYDFFTEEFSKAIKEVNDLMFYFFVYNIHEETAELSYLRSTGQCKIPVEGTNFAQYRRILKLILQESCSVQMSECQHPSAKWMASTISKIEKLLLLGDFAFDMVNTISEHKFTDGSIEIRFDNDLYVFDNPPEWKGFLNNFHDNFPLEIEGSIHDETIQQKIDTVLNQEFGIDLKVLSLVVEHIAEDLYNQMPPRLCKVAELISLFAKQSNSSNINPFINGLILNKENVAKLKSGIYSAYNGDRLIHRPFLDVNLDGTDCILFGRYTLMEAINTLCQNQITHGKIPLEWKQIPSMKKVQKELVAYHKDILENPVEQLLIGLKIPHERNVKTLKTANHYENMSINDWPGEIDFIIILNQRVYLADCKNVTKRYEMHGYYQDSTKFIPYNKKMRDKIEFMVQQKDRLQTHLRIVAKNHEFNLDDHTIEGIFIVNTPTLYAINSPYKIYSFYNFELLIKGRDVYEKQVVIADADKTEIKWPYLDNYHRYLAEKNT